MKEISHYSNCNECLFFCLKSRGKKGTSTSSHILFSIVYFLPPYFSFMFCSTQCATSEHSLPFCFAIITTVSVRSDRLKWRGKSNKKKKSLKSIHFFITMGFQHLNSDDSNAPFNFHVDGIYFFFLCGCQLTHIDVLCTS